MLQRTLPAGFIAPCLPTKTDKLPSGSQWLHEIKHDGFRIIARKNGAQVRLYSHPGNDLTHRFPLIAETLARLRSRSCIIDGEAVACDDNGVASFDLVRHHRANESILKSLIEGVPAAALVSEDATCNRFGVVCGLQSLVAEWTSDRSAFRRRRKGPGASPGLFSSVTPLAPPPANAASPPR